MVPEVGLSLHRVPDLLPLQRDGVPVELHRNPAGLGADCEHQHVLAPGHGDHPDHLDCQEQEHEGENQNCHRMLARVIKNESAKTETKNHNKCPTRKCIASNLTTARKCFVS